MAEQVDEAVKALVVAVVAAAVVAVEMVTVAALEFYPQRLLETNNRKRPSLTFFKK